MPKTVIVRARSKESLDTADIQVNASFPTIEEALKGKPELKTAFEHAAHATFAINLQSKLRANATLEKVADRKPAQAVADAIDYATMGTRQRGGLTDNKKQLAFGEIAASGNVKNIEQAIALDKAGDMVVLDKFLKQHAPKTFTKKVKAEVTEAKK